VLASATEPPASRPPARHCAARAHAISKAAAPPPMTTQRAAAGGCAIQCFQPATKSAKGLAPSTRTVLPGAMSPGRLADPTFSDSRS
jgi:hypothetical protein